SVAITRSRLTGANGRRTLTGWAVSEPNCCARRAASTASWRSVTEPFGLTYAGMSPALRSAPDRSAAAADETTGSSEIARPSSSGSAAAVNRTSLRDALVPIRPGCLQHAGPCSRLRFLAGRPSLAAKDRHADLLDLCQDPLPRLPAGDPRL